MHCADSLLIKRLLGWLVCSPVKENQAAVWPPLAHCTEYLFGAAFPYCQCFYFSAILLRQMGICCIFTKKISGWSTCSFDRASLQQTRHTTLQARLMLLQEVRNAAKLDHRCCPKADRMLQSSTTIVVKSDATIATNFFFGVDHSLRLATPVSWVQLHII